ncbi:MAG: Gfo/Idh/MocA family protein [Nitrososphaerales archaeon]
MPPVTLMIIGAGQRGQVYAEYARLHPEQARIVAVAEPRNAYRARLAGAHRVPPENVVADWRDLLRPALADALIIATPDRLHTEPAVAFAGLGYDILLEKPMAPTAAECEQIVQAVRASGVVFAVAHVMRYGSYTQRLKGLIASGLIGDLVCVQHLEPVGFSHQAHSFVRGNWRNEAASTFMLMSKSCHDIDWLRYIMGRRCVQVSSFGSLMHFRKEKKPPEAGEAARCVDCTYEPRCAYSAKRIYFAAMANSTVGASVLDILTPDHTTEGLLKALAEGPYGRCVYECDNDVVDHQVVNLLYEDGATASFTMTAFTEWPLDRQTRLFGTLGELRGDGRTIRHYDFYTFKEQVIEVPPATTELLVHSDADYLLMQGFVEAVATRDQGKVLSGPDETLETHLTVFAAEQARREGRVVAVNVH